MGALQSLQLTDHTSFPGLQETTNGKNGKRNGISVRGACSTRQGCHPNPYTHHSMSSSHVIINSMFQSLPAMQAKGPRALKTSPKKNPGSRLTNTIDVRRVSERPTPRPSSVLHAVSSPVWSEQSVDFLLLFLPATTPQVLHRVLSLHFFWITPFSFTLVFLGVTAVCSIRPLFFVPEPPFPRFGPTSSG